MVRPLEPPVSVVGVLRDALGSRPRQLLAGATLLFGVLGVVGGLLGTRPGDPVLAVVASSALSLISVAVPFMGVLMMDDLRRRPRVTPRAFWTTVGAAVAYAVGCGLIGDVLSVLATLVRNGPNAWAHTPTILVGGLLVQVLAQLVGTGLGWLLRPPVVAMVASVLVPLGVWFVLGSIGPLRPAQWFTPYAGAARLLAGAMTPLRWAQWLITFLVWGVGLNLAAYTRRPVRKAAASSRGHRPGPTVPNRTVPPSKGNRPRSRPPQKSRRR